MIYTPEQIDQVEKLASIFMKPSAIALIIEVDADAFKADIADPNSEVGRKYRRGKALSQVELNQQEMQLAKVGSPMALENVRHNLLDMEDDE